MWETLAVKLLGLVAGADLENLDVNLETSIPDPNGGEAIKVNVTIKGKLSIKFK
ncbi:MAG: hypothetical protein LBS00_11595 [Synergistaceae bacterium]|jgi:hypothetical protein|nr:hypothetical protein [Synergistaceae bacterium]